MAIDLESLRQKVQEKRKEKRERDEYSRLSNQLYELENPELIRKQKMKEQSKAKFRANVSKFFKNARKNIAEGSRELNRRRSPKATARRLRDIQGVGQTQFSIMSPPSKKGRREEFSLI